MVRELRQPGDPPLRGPVLGALLADEGQGPRSAGLVERPEVAAPSATLVDELIDRTEQVMDSTVAARYPSLQVRPLHSTQLEINTLADLDAADVIAFRTGSKGIRYAVSLRERRVRAGGQDTLVATAVMVWDSAGTWRQTIFRPTLLAALGGRLDAVRSGPPAVLLAPAAADQRLRLSARQSLDGAGERAGRNRALGNRAASRKRGGRGRRGRRGVPVV